MDKIFDHLNAIVLLVGLFFTFTLLLCYFKRLRSRALISFLPNIWTSLGILGTFVSIVRSLGNSGNITDLPKIIEQITPAFETSIIGIIGAIATSLMVKFIFAKEDKEYEQENERKSVSKNMTPELLLDSISQSVSTTNSKIDNIATQIASGILLEVDRHLTYRLEELARSHTARLVSIFEHEEDSISNAVAKVNSAVDELERTMRHISATVSDSTRRAADAATDGIVRMSNNMLDRTERMFEDLRMNVISMAEASAIRAQEISNNCTERIANIEETVITSLSNKLNDRYDHLVQMNEASIRETENMIRRLQSDIAAQTANEVSAIHSGIFNQINQQLQSMKNDLTQINASISQSLTNVTANLAATTQTMSATSVNYQDITSSTAEIKQSFIRLEAALSNCVSKLDTHSSRLESMISKSQDLHDLNYKLSYELTQLKKATPQTSASQPDGSIVCPNCKTPNPSDANFCRHCRYKFA